MTETTQGRAARPDGGFTLIESIVSMTVVTLLVGGALLFTGSAIRSASVTQTLALLDANASRAMSEIVEELNHAGVARLNPPNPVAPIGTHSLTYQRVIGFDGLEPVWGAPRRVEFQPDPQDPDDGIDNDGDGLVDEGRVVLVSNSGLPTEQTRVLATGVSEFLEGEDEALGDDNGNLLDNERGLCFAREEGHLIIRLSLQTTDFSGRRFTRTVETSVSPRN